MVRKKRDRAKGKRFKVVPVSKKKGAETFKVALIYEHDMQKLIVNTTKLIQYKGGKVYDYIHHTPNGGLRTKYEGNMFKEMGVKAGYPDLTIDIVTKQFAGLRIELKRGSDGALSEEQITLLIRLNNEGYYAVSCNSFESAIEVIKLYIKGMITSAPIRGCQTQF